MVDIWNQLYHPVIHPFSDPYNNIFFCDVPGCSEEGPVTCGPASCHLSEALIRSRFASAANQSGSESRLDICLCLLLWGACILCQESKRSNDFFFLICFMLDFITDSSAYFTKYINVQWSGNFHMFVGAVRSCRSFLRPCLVCWPSSSSCRQRRSKRFRQGLTRTRWGTLLSSQKDTRWGKEVKHRYLVYHLFIKLWSLI